MAMDGMTRVGTAQGDGSPRSTSHLTPWQLVLAIFFIWAVGYGPVVLSILSADKTCVGSPGGLTLGASGPALLRSHGVESPQPVNNRGPRPATLFQTLTQSPPSTLSQNWVSRASGADVSPSSITSPMSCPGAHSSR